MQVLLLLAWTAGAWSFFQVQPAVGPRRSALQLGSLVISARKVATSAGQIRGLAKATNDALSLSGLSSPLGALPSVGSAVIGQVDDQDENSIAFLIKGGFRASLPTGNLSWQERMTLQVGAMMQLYVARHDEATNQVVVALQPPSGVGLSMPTLSQPSGLPQSWTSQPPKAPKLASTKRPSASKASGAAAANSNFPPEADEPKGTLLNNLKTGMKLTGTVSSCTPFAAFVSVGVQRMAKGGQLKTVHGMLHKSDIPKDLLPKRTRGPDGQVSLLEPASQVTVYVKEVYKNSARFSVTMDATIEKASIIQHKIQVKEEGKERRRSRRLRRVLDTVTVGDTLSGVVDRVVPEGVLITITSLGPLNVTGLLRKKDLPKQFDVPPDLKESFQAQLLGQDFIPGRAVTCGVLQVSTNTAPQEGEYSMRLLFESLGPMPEDGFVVSDKLDKKKTKKTPLLEDTDDEELPAPEDSDLKEIYTELRGNKPLMLVQDLYDWADIQDMLADGDIEQSVLDNALVEVGIPRSKGMEAEVRFMQFQEIVEIIQDGMDGVDTKAYDDDEELAAEDDEDDEEAALPAKSSPIVMAAPASPSPSPSKANAKPNAKPNAKAEVDEEGTPVSADAAAMEDLEDEAIEEVAQEIFDELRGKAKSLSVKAFREWSDIQDLQQNELIVEADIAAALYELGVEESLDFRQFFLAVQLLEDRAAENGMDFEEGEEGDEDEAEDKEGDEGDEYFEIDEAEEEAMLQEFFDKLKGKSGKVTTAAFRKWDEIVAADVPAAELEAVLLAEGVGKSGMNFAQFVAVVRKLDESEEVEDEEDDEESGKALALKDEGEEDEIEIDFDDENMTPEENEEMLKMLFDTLRGKKPTVTLKTFMAWDDIQDMLSEGVLDQEAIDIFLDEVGYKKGSDLNYEQFAALVTMLDENMRAMGDGAAEAGAMERSSSQGEGEEDEDEMEIDDAELEEVAQEIYDELRGKAKSLSIKAFKQWDEVKSAVAAGILSDSTLDTLVKEVAAPKASDLSFDEFKQLVQLLDEAADAAMGADDEDDEAALVPVPVKSAARPNSAARVAATLDDDDDEDGEVLSQDEGDEPTEEELEQFAREIYDELKSAKSGRVTVKAFRAWEGVQEVLESGELASADLKEIIDAVDTDNKGSLSFAQFREVMDLIEAKLDDSAFDEDEDDEGDDDDGDEDDQDDEEEEEVAPVKKGKDAGKGFARDEPAKPKAGAKATTKASAKAASGDDDDEALEVAREIFDDLRGKKKTLSVKTFKEWEETKDLVDSGALKRSTLEKAIVKVGAYESGEMTLEQFVSLVDIIQGSIDESALSLDEEDGDEDPSSRIPTSKQGKVMKVGASEQQDEDEDAGADIDWENEEDATEMSDEEEARMVFDELRGSRDVLPLVEFLKWEDVQELLECGALSKDNLATAIENAGLTVDKGDLSFESVRPRTPSATLCHPLFPHPIPLFRPPILTHLISDPISPPSRPLCAVLRPHPDYRRVR